MKSITNTFLYLSYLCAGVFFYSAQAQTISGNVTNESGVPLPGASVIIEGTSNGVSTDFDGNYSIEASQGQSLVFSYVGYTSQTITVSSNSQIIKINAQLSSNSELEVVVVTALGIYREKNLWDIQLKKLEEITLTQ